MNIRLASIDDIDVIMDIYAAARRFMQDTGNKNQWVDGYPSKDLISSSIQEGKQYVCICENQVAGTFYFSIDDDPTYAKIYNGEWLNDSPYGVVHRLASGGKYRGVANFCLQWCFDQCGNVRVDTHKDNAVMQEILKKNGYVPCGIIFVRNDTERLAFQKIYE